MRIDYEVIRERKREEGSRRGEKENDRGKVYKER